MSVVSLLLEKGQVTRALQVARAVPPGTSYGDQVRMRVAAAVSDEDPRAAIELYQQAAAPYLSKTGRRNYEQIIFYLRLMHPLYARLGALDEWQAAVDGLRRRYPGRKVLLEMLDALPQ
jgi:uncharacterized Zn finger protein